MLTESDATRLWRELFRGQSITVQLLAEADLLVGELPLESPLRSRYATELTELRNRDSLTQSKKKR